MPDSQQCSQTFFCSLKQFFFHLWVLFKSNLFQNSGEIIKIKQISCQKNDINTFHIVHQIKVSLGTGKSHECPSLNGGSLLSTITIPLKQRWDFKSLNPMRDCFASFLSMKTRALKRENPKMVGSY